MSSLDCQASLARSLGVCHCHSHNRIGRGEQPRAGLQAGAIDGSTAERSSDGSCGRTRKSVAASSAAVAASAAEDIVEVVELGTESSAELAATEGTMDVTGDRDWDSGVLLRRLLTDDAASAAALPAATSLPPAHVLELGAGTGSMACALAAHWRGVGDVQYLATDLPERVAAIAGRAAAHGLTSPVLRVKALEWGEAPPPLPPPEAVTRLVLLADLLYFAGKPLFEPDTLEPLVTTLGRALAQQPRSVALATFRERDPEREAHFRRLCTECGMQVAAPLDEAQLAALLPPEEHADVEASGPLRLWRISLAQAHDA